MSFLPGALPAAIGGIGSLVGGIASGVGSLAGGIGSAAGDLAAGSAMSGWGNALTLGGIGLSGFSGYEGAARSNAAARYNASAAQAEAASTLQSGVAAEQQQRLRTAQTIGAAQAAYGAGGVDTGSGSPLQVEASTAQMGEFDALATRANYFQRANALQLQSQADLDSQVNPFLAGTTSLLSSVRRFY